MFGMGMGELLLILVVALLVVGPDKLPQAAKAIGKGIRDFRRHSQELQSTLEQDEKLGEAVRELRSALRDDPLRPLRAQFRAPVPLTPPATEPLAGSDAAAGTGSSQEGAPGSASDPAPGSGPAALQPPRVIPAAGAVAKHPPDARPDPRPAAALPRSEPDDRGHG
jgi:Tat protein translocase TatB subunit